MSGYKDEVLGRLNRALNVKRLSDIARDVNVTPDALRKFRESRYMATDKVRVLDLYLVSMLEEKPSASNLHPALQAELDWYRSGRIFAATCGLPGEANNIEVIYQCDSAGTFMGETLGEFYDRKIKEKE